MKVLFLTRGMPPPFLGGSGVYYYNIFRRFQPGEVTVFTEHSRASGYDQNADDMCFKRRAYIRPAFIKSRKIQCLQRIPGRRMLDDITLVAIWAMDLLQHCLKNKVDVVFIGQLYPVGILGLWVHKLFNLPYIVFLHGEELSKDIKRGGIRLRVNKFVLRKAHSIIANSTFTRNLIIESGIDASHVHIVTPMVDCNVFHPHYDISDIRKKNSIDDHKVLLSVGRLTRRKGHYRVVSILPKLISNFKNIKYIIVGTDAGEAHTLKKQAYDLGVEDSVILLGRIPIEDLPKYYCLCDVMVLPNYELPSRDTEGFGMVFLEANACGKPVVGGRAGGTEDAVIHEETGLLVYDTNDDGLFEAINQLLRDEMYANRLGQNGKLRVLNSFDWQTAAFKVRQIAFSAKNCA